MTFSNSGLREPPIPVHQWLHPRSLLLPRSSHFQLPCQERNWSSHWPDHGIQAEEGCSLCLRCSLHLGTGFLVSIQLNSSCNLSSSWSVFIKIQSNNSHFNFSQRIWSLQPSVLLQADLWPVPQLAAMWLPTSSWRGPPEERQVQPPRPWTFGTSHGCKLIIPSIAGSKTLK